MLKSISFAVVIFTVIFSTISLQAQIQMVKVTGGKAEGIVNDGVASFKGIPFAAPPIGDLRWRPPQPVKKWKGMLNAEHFAPACPQLAITIMSSTPQKTSEDCLYLNIWTPAKSSKDKLPVMVWIHGGGFVMGSTSTPNYNGERLAKEGVVIVSIAYRLGVLGFLAHPELTAESAYKVSGNYGLLDLIQGLKWIKKNIKAFGGDPSRVTIFGESSG
jgi:para-nitrobenzyl esterase